jgi:hypothetical protein
MEKWKTQHLSICFCNIFMMQFVCQEAIENTVSFCYNM